MKRYDLMHEINTRGTFLCSQACLPHLLKAANPHILNLSPPLNMEARWFAPHVAYTMAKFGMSLCVLGMAEEFHEQGIAVNALWPQDRDRHRRGAEPARRRARSMQPRRKPEIMADAAHAILTRASRECTGNFFIDEDVLRDAGVTDFDSTRHAGERADSGFLRLNGARAFKLLARSSLTATWSLRSGTRHTVNPFKSSLAYTGKVRLGTVPEQPAMSDSCQMPSDGAISILVV